MNSLFNTEKNFNKISKFLTKSALVEDIFVLLCELKNRNIIPIVSFLSDDKIEAKKKVLSQRGVEFINNTNLCSFTAKLSENAEKELNEYIFTYSHKSNKDCYSVMAKIPLADLIYSFVYKKNKDGTYTFFILESGFLDLEQFIVKNEYERYAGIILFADVVRKAVKTTTNLKRHTLPSGKIPKGSFKLELSPNTRSEFELDNLEERLLKSLDAFYRSNIGSLFTYTASMRKIDDSCYTFVLKQNDTVSVLGPEVRVINSKLIVIK